MASNASKARRRAAALNRLDDLAVQIGERMGVAVPDLKLKGGDPELAQIQQMEATADLLESVLKASGGIVEERPDGSESGEQVDDAGLEPVAESKSSRKSTKKAAKKSRRK